MGGVGEEGSEKILGGGGGGPWNLHWKGRSQERMERPSAQGGRFLRRAGPRVPSGERGACGRDPVRTRSQPFLGKLHGLASLPGSLPRVLQIIAS